MKSTMLLALLLVGGCSGPAVNTGGVPRWQMVTTVGGFVLTLPLGLKATPVQGIDSAVSRFQGSGLTTFTDYGEHGGTPDERSWVRNEIVVDGRRGVLARGRLANGNGMQFSAIANFPRPSAPDSPESANESRSLTVSARCRTEVDCDLGDGVIRNLRFPASFPPS